MRITGSWRRILLPGLIVGGMTIAGCGSSGSGGAPIPPQPVTTSEICSACHAQGGISPVDRHLALAEQVTYNAEITSIDIVGGAGDPEVTVTVEFTVTDSVSGQGVPGLTDDFEYTMAKWLPGDGRHAGNWQSYLNRSRTGPINILRAAGERRPAEDLGGGRYTYTFGTNLGAAGVAAFRYFGAAGAPDGQAVGIGSNGELTSPAALTVLPALNLLWEDEAVHRIAISSLADPSVYRFNAVADFIPGTGEILPEFFNWAATTESCNACHATSTPGSRMSLPNVHGDRRFEVTLCVTCHNANTFDRQASTDAGWVPIDLTTMIHKIHRGEEGYVVDGRDYTGLPYPQDLTGVGGVMNCRACHNNQLLEQPENRSAANAELWLDASVQGCGACHPVAMTGGVEAPLAEHFAPLACATCHSPAVPLGAEFAHLTNFSTPNNPLIPAGAAVLVYEIDQVTVNQAHQPSVRFRVLADGVPLNVKAAQPLPGNITFSGTNPNFKIAWSDPVGAVQTPVDWTNTGGATRTYWDGNVNLDQSVADQPSTAGLAAIVESLEGPDAEGWFTTAPGINPAAPLAFPADATLRAVFMEGNFTFPALGNASISGESVIAGVNADHTPRRQIVDINSCNRCHERIRFHGGGGRDNNPDHCVTCHNPSMTSSNVQTETSNNFKDMIHAIHAGDPVGGAGMRENPYIFIRGNVDATTGGQGLHDFSRVGYPSRLSDCRTCHFEGTYRLPLAGNILSSTYIHDLDDPTQSLKITPASAACTSCHDSAGARGHMERTGGMFFATQAEIDAGEFAPPVQPPVD
jgi:OmcA/MtrC family decaheme c-type cytochrome